MLNYHPRPLCCSDLGAEVRRHFLPDSELSLLHGCCRRSDDPRVRQRVISGPDLHCAPSCLLPATLQRAILCACITAALSALPAPRGRRTCTWVPHLRSRTCTWPPAPAHGPRTALSSRAPCTYPRTAAAYNVPSRTHQLHKTHPKKQAYHPNNCSTSTRHRAA